MGLFTRVYQKLYNFDVFKSPTLFWFSALNKSLAVALISMLIICHVFVFMFWWHMQWYWYILKKEQQCKLICIVIDYTIMYFTFSSKINGVRNFCIVQGNVTLLISLITLLLQSRGISHWPRIDLLQGLRNKLI